MEPQCPEALALPSRVLVLCSRPPAPPRLHLELSSSGSLQKPSPVTAIPQRLALFKGPVAPSLSRQGLWLAGTSVPRPAQSWVEKVSKCLMTGNSVLLCLKAQDSTGHRYLPVLPTPPHPQPQKVAQRALLLVLDSSPQTWRELSVVREY